MAASACVYEGQALAARTGVEPIYDTSRPCAISAKVCGNQRINRARVSRAFARIAQINAVFLSESVRNAPSRARDSCDERCRLFVMSQNPKSPTGASTTGSNNIDIGNEGLAGESKKIRIGTQGTHNGTFIAGIAGVPATGSQVVINLNGQLGVATSSARFKKAVKPMNKASEAILALEPVTFHYKEEIDPDNIPQFGLIAEQVEKVNPDLVARDDQGKAYTPRRKTIHRQGR
jgi:hypothetical protein